MQTWRFPEDKELYIVTRLLGLFWALPTTSLFIYVIQNKVREIKSWNTKKYLILIEFMFNLCTLRESIFTYIKQPSDIYCTLQCTLQNDFLGWLFQSRGPNWSLNQIDSLSIDTVNLYPTMSLLEFTEPTSMVTSWHPSLLGYSRFH